ncbi:MAG: hypothetical protein RBS84_04775 [Kiritimatiellia bacterium]|jgi:hypothetical protein|nr:hypothetical protein [Kiritimatiellia bacterium]
MKFILPQAGSLGDNRVALSVFWLVLFAIAGAIVFHALWAPGAILMSTDDNVGLERATQRMLEASVVHPWNGEALWGLPGMSMVRPGYLLLRVVSAEWFMNTFHGLCLTLAAWLLALYLRDKGLRPAACIFGGLVAFWVGTNLTLVYAGHVGKYGTLVFLALTIFALGRWGRTGRRAWGVVAGSAAGAMFLEQPDVALFCALLLVPLGLFEASRAVGGWHVAALAKQAGGGILAAALVAGGASLAAKGSGVTEVPGGEAPEAHWDYITQWSQPPSESLDFIAPGWTGWRSGDAQGPYWGKMGRSEGWEQTRQGFMNFKLENVYVGVIPLLFALLGVVESVRRRRENREAPAVWLWGGLCLLALLLAFGKFFPLYRGVSLLPGFSSIRNPNKFIHFFQVAWGVLAAFGLDAALRMDGRATRKWIWGEGIAAALFLLSGMALWADLGAGAERLAAAGWGAMGHAIQWNKAFSVTYAGIAFAVGAGILWLLSGRVFHSVERNLPQCGKNGENLPRCGSRMRGTTVWKTWAMWIPALIVLFDATVILAPHYIQTMPPGLVAENELVRYLRQEIGHHRTAMVTQDGFYNQWLTYLFPYQSIPSVNVTQLPRPPADYQAFWAAVKDPLRTWQLTGVSHVLAHGPVAQQLLANPAWAAHLELAWAYQPYNDGRGGVATRPVQPTLEAPEVVLKVTPVPARVAAVESWREVEDDVALQTLADPAFEPFSAVLLSPNSGIPAAAPRTGEMLPAKVNVEKVIPGRYEFSVENTVPTMVRVAEKFDPGWQATIDGEKVPLMRVDYMFQGIYLAETGRHEVVLRHAPSSLPLLLQGAGLLAGVAAAGWLLVPRRKKDEGTA